MLGKAAAQKRGQGAVDLDGHHAACGVGQQVGQPAGAGAEGDDGAEAFGYPSTPEDTSMDPDDLGFGFYEET